MVKNENTQIGAGTRLYYSRYDAVSATGVPTILYGDNGIAVGALVVNSELKHSIRFLTAQPSSISKQAIALQAPGDVTVFTVPTNYPSPGKCPPGVCPPISGAIQATNTQYRDYKISSVDVDTMLLELN